MEKVKHLRLYRQSHVLYRRVKWALESMPAARKPAVLKLLRQVAILRRRAIWIDKWSPGTVRHVIDILKEIYVPAITELFAKQTTTYDLFRRQQA